MARKTIARAKLSEETREMIWEKLQSGEAPKELVANVGTGQMMAAVLEMCAIESLPDFVRMVRDQRKRALQGEDSAVKWLTDFLLKMKPETAGRPGLASIEEAKQRLKEYGYEDI